ncbi:PREDICTED: uncharacterized protein LOC104826804 [Tarenaya hassleriana]|uniref:uncharacterized protein LOC104826804 n=1 Tax=Tarenaya hassleriana TaxID=28532 RepID=UPI00053C8B19|nr:PREDICTED: uncharacterized protein LOC104826804 [Tarenaya hassleriana]
MHGLTVTGAVLLAVFSVFLLALLAELSYFLCLYRRSRARARVGDAPHAPPGKELLLFFLCRKNQSRIEPAANAPPMELRSPEETAEEAEEDVAAKWQMDMLYGPSRFLFTIEEEEGEDGCSAEDIGSDGDASRRLNPAEIGGSPPFSTPCASPPYYTPWPSPGREDISVDVGD